ncbi:arsenate reductase (glutaredoxin) [Crenothrix polyspora]|nr:arsenate reductase (glutaredoxin) [Crenothrix polyspora]
MRIKIYHNPRCSKSRQTLQLLTARGIDVEIIEYLKTPPSVDELDDILQKLGLEPRQLMRQKQAEYQQNNLDDVTLDKLSLLAFMVKYPVLIERPIVVANGKAALGRPPEAVISIL